MTKKEKIVTAASVITTAALGATVGVLYKKLEKAKKQRDYFESIYKMELVQNHRKSRILEEASNRWLICKHGKREFIDELLGSIEHRYWYGVITEEVMRDILGPHPLTTED